MIKDNKIRGYKNKKLPIVYDAVSEDGVLKEKRIPILNKAIKVITKERTELLKHVPEIYDNPPERALMDCTISGLMGMINYIISEK